MRGGGQQDLVEKSRVVLKSLFQDLAEGAHSDACSSLFRRWKKRAEERLKAESALRNFAIISMAFWKQLLVREGNKIIRLAGWQLFLQEPFFLKQYA